VAYHAGSGITVYGPVGSNIVVVGSGATDYVLASGTAVSTTVSSGGTEDIYAGGTASFTNVTTDGTEIVSRGGTAVGATFSGGNFLIAPQNTASEQFVRFGGTAVSTTLNSGSIEFVDSAGTISATTVNSGGTEFVSSGGIATSTTVHGGGTELVLANSIVTLTSVGIGGAIVLGSLAYAPGGSATVNTSDVLTVSVGGQTYMQQLSGDYSGVSFGLSLGQGLDAGTVVTAETGVPCFRAGTRILTNRGEVAVEELCVGDLVQTVLGSAGLGETGLGETGLGETGLDETGLDETGLDETGPGNTGAPIIWIGQREVDCARHPKPKQVWPVRVAAGAFGPGRPHTDLFLSPNHAVYVNEVLIPIRHLIDGSTITQVPVDRVTYYHIELPQHDVVLAQGLPAESYLDMKDRSDYANGPGPIRLYPNFYTRMWEAFGCARLIVTGPEFAVARALVASFAEAQGRRRIRRPRSARRA
jgi:autotransporter passenger strand-loop-strand repeat protein